MWRRAAQYILTPFKRMPKTSRLVATAGCLGLVLGTGLIPVLCPFNFLTGLDCPFCGGSRMIGALLQADFARALDLNAFALLVILPMAAIVLVAMGRQELGHARGYWPPGKRGRILSQVLIAALVAWTVVRNLPFEPFTILRA